MKVTETGNIEFKHFIEIYNIIEACIKLELHDQRDNNERQRSSLFIGAFTDNNQSKMEEYIDLVLKTMEHECDEYAPVLQKVLKHAGVQQIIWESSMEVHMPAGESFVRHASIFSLSSPYIYDGEKSKQQILDIYREAVEFGIAQLGQS